jgi:hypothetical protein
VTTYSVYKPDTRSYDYYQSDAPGNGTHAGSPPVRLGRSPLGATPDQAAWRVPPDARKVGSGAMPMGRIATMGSAGALGDVDISSPWTWIVGGVIAYFAWKGLR